MNRPWWKTPALTPRIRAGRRAERYVARCMKRRGYSILERNYAWKGGEIDLIARRGGLIVIMEVRFKRTGTLRDAIETVVPDKRQRIIRSAERFLQRNPNLAHCQVRFDVAGVSSKGLFLECDWVENAFSAEQANGNRSW